MTIDDLNLQRMKPNVTAADAANSPRTLRLFQINPSNFSVDDTEYNPPGRNILKDLFKENTSKIISIFTPKFYSYPATGNTQLTIDNHQIINHQ